MATLSEPAQELLRLASAGRTRISGSVLAGVAGTQETELLPALREAVGRQILARSPLDRMGLMERAARAAANAGRPARAVAHICGSSEAADDADGLVAAVSEALTALAAEGLATRVAGSGGDDDGGTWRWASGRSSDEAAAALDSASGGEARTRLRPGALRSRVLVCVRAQPGVELSPTTVARSLNASSGAVSNALERLVELGEVARTSEKPRRFAATTGIRNKRRS